MTDNTYPTLSLDDEMAAYNRVKHYFRLEAKRRNLLDASPMLGAILRHAHLGEMDVAGGLLVEAGVIDLVRMAGTLSPLAMDDPSLAGPNPSGCVKGL